MPYTNKVKEEILHKENNDNINKRFELYSILASKKAIYPDKIEFKTENIALAKKVYSYLKEFSKTKILIKYSKSKIFGEHKVYFVIVPFQRSYKKIYEYFEELKKEKIHKNDKKLAGYIKGIFLTSGYIKHPEKEYALDFFIEDSSIAEHLYKTLKESGKKAHITSKKKHNLVYIRNSEDILDILVLIEALKSFFEYEEVTMLKEIKNKTIRSMNWEVANDTKMINTAQNQLNMIEYIEKNGGSDKMTSVLWEIAEVRKENEEASLSEIAEIIGISKSGVRNRFRRIKSIYDELRESEN